MFLAGIPKNGKALWITGLYRQGLKKSRELMRKLLQEHPACADFHIMDDVSFGSIAKEVGLYYRAGKNLTASAGNFISLCESFWSL